jgi:hypothetical protein
MNDPAKWLRETARIVADTPPPELPWDRIEQRILDQIESCPAPRPPLSPDVPWKRLVAMAAIAAASVVGLHHVARPVSTSAYQPPATALSQEPVTAAPSRAASGALSPGMRLHPAQPTSYEHGGWVSFALAAGANITVDRSDDRVVLSLVSGSIGVAVAPGQPAGSFVILAGKTAVAVHGTRFHVVRRADSVLVRVEEGVVSVGEMSRTGPTTRWLLGAHAQGSFSLDGARRASFSSWSPRPRAPVVASQPPGESPVAEAAVESSAESGPAAGPTKPHDDPPVRAAKPPVEEDAIPEQLTLALADATIGPMVAGIHDCYRSAASTMAPGVKVTVQSSLSITVAPDGHVVFARFDPPLKPDAQVCASGVVKNAKFPRAVRPSQLQVELQF